MFMSTKRWPIIDTHFHVGVNLIDQFMCEEELIPYLDGETDIDYQVIFQVNEGFVHKTPDWNPYLGNDYIAKIQKMFPDRVLGLGTVNPWYQPPAKYRWPSKKVGQKFDLNVKNETIEELERCLTDLNLCGLKMHPYEYNFPVNDPFIVFPIMEKMTQLQKEMNKQFFIVVHCGGDSMWNSPEAIADIARRYPDILFIAAHTAIIWGWETALSVFKDLDNVLMDLTISPLTNIAYEATEEVGPNRFAMGTDGPFDTFALKKTILHQLFKDPDDRELVEGGNIAKRIGLPKTDKPKREVQLNEWIPR